MIIDIVCTFSATTIQAETKSVSLVLTFPATQLPSNICEEVQDCLGISPSGEADYFLNEQGDWVQVQGGAVDSVNGQTGVVVLDTDDIQDTANNRYTNDTDITRLANTSGTNTGDQDLSGLVPYTGATQNVNLGTYNLIADQVALNVTPNGTLAVGGTEWNDTVGVSQTLLKGGSVTLKNGVDLVARVVNKVSPNTTLTKAAYQVVKISGAQGQRLAVNLAQANNDNNSADTLGVVTETIAPNQEGFIMTVGQLEGINTTGSLQGETWADGNVLYLSPTVAGRITNVKPTGATGHIVIIGYVEYAHANNGKIYVKIMNGWELDELHNVYINTGTLANNDALIYESSTQLWKNKTIATALGFTPENVANKENTTLDSSTTKYPTNNLVKTYADAKVTDAIVDGVTTIAPSQNAVFDALALKQNSLGFTPENVANKSDSYTVSSSTTYASTKALVDGLATKQNTSALSIIGVLPDTVLVSAASTVEVLLHVIPFDLDALNYHYRVTAMFNNTGSSNATTFRMRVGQYATPINGNVGVDAIANQTQIAIVTGATSGRFTRNIRVTPTELIHHNSTNTGISDETQINQATGTTALDRTTQKYLYISSERSGGANAILYSAFALRIKM